jgi:rhodanese-related sulfurtransferase
MKSRNVHRRFALAVMFVALVAGCSPAGEKTSTADRKEESSTTEAFARLDPAAFAERMKEGEIEQTDAFIPYDKIRADSRLPKDKNTEILLYCRSGNMSEEAGAVLHEDGYTKVAHLEGGMKAWEAAGHKLVNNPANVPAQAPTPMPRPLPGG